FSRDWSSDVCSSDLLNGKNYTATTAADGTWSLTVPAADLSGLGEASYTLSATATNGVGNSISTTANLLVDTALPTVTINTVAGEIGRASCRERITIE